MIKVLVADDHPIVRRGLKSLLAEESGIQVVAEAHSAEEALAVVASEACDVLVMDISMPGRGGLDVLDELRRMNPRPAVLILSVHSAEQYAIRAIQAGAAGYLTKGTAPEELVAAIRKVATGGKYISAGLAEQLVLHLTGAHKPLHEMLSAREYQVLRMFGAGKTVLQIADELSLSPKTVNTYRTRILNKLQLQTSAELVHYAVRHYLVDG